MGLVVKGVLSSRSRKSGYAGPGQQTHPPVHWAHDRSDFWQLSQPRHPVADRRDALTKEEELEVAVSQRSPGVRHGTPGKGGLPTIRTDCGLAHKLCSSLIADAFSKGRLRPAISRHFRGMAIP